MLWQRVNVMEVTRKGVYQSSDEEQWMERLRRPEELGFLLSFSFQRG